jgi:predicted ATPase
LLTGDVEARRVTGVIDQEQAGGLWNLVPQAVQALVNAGPDLIDIFIPGPALIARAAMAAPNGEPTPEAARWLAQLEALVARQESSRGRANVQQNALFEQYTRVLQTLAAQRPLLLVLDDLQWADVGSISLLFHLGRRLEGSRILIVGIYRPAEVALGRPSTSSRERERHPLEPVVNEFQRHFGSVHIDLRQAEGERFVQQFLDTEPNRLGPGFQEALYKHTRGHALFTVEMVRGMQERGDLVQDEAGRWVEGPAIDWMTLPARVEGVIAERIGRLATSLQKVLQVASVEGEDFTAEVVAQVRGVDERKIVEQLSSALDRQHRLVRGQGNRRLGAGGPRLSLYRFRHILIQRYLYHNLDEAEQVYLHEAVGQVLERLHSEQTEEAAVQLARHFEVAGLTAKAVKYLRQAGERAVRLSANEEAITHFTRALVLLETLPDTPERTEQELALQIALGVPLIATKGYAAPEVEKAYARARELCHQAYAGETPFLFPALRGLWNNYLQRAELQAAHELAEQLFSLAQNAQDPALLVEAHRALGTTLFFLGEFAQARVRVEQGIALYAPQQHRSLAFVYGADPGLVCRLYAALSLWYLGYPDQALKRMDETLSLAQELAHPHSLAFVLSFAAWLHDERQEGQAAQERAEAAITLSTEQGFPDWLAQGTIMRGWALAEQGQGEAGIAQMRQGSADWRAIGAKAGWPLILALLARAYRKVGQIEAGLNTLAEALAAVNKNGVRFYEAEIYRLKGELLLKAEGRRAEEELSPEACFLKAIEVAQQQEAKSLELRAVMSLCRLWQKQGKREKARQMLAEICNWFTEGFDTADLKKAKTLLEELS